MFGGRSGHESAGHLWIIKKNDVILSIYNIFTFDVEKLLHIAEKES